MRQEYTPSSVFVRARLAFQNARDSLWFLPALLVLMAAVLAFVLLGIDSEVDGSGAQIKWLFSGSAQSARTVLTVVAGSLINVVAVAFSVTVLAIQQASNQYSPRILRNFTRDRGNQVVLGAYIATFVFSLLVLRRVREASGGRAEFVPSLSVTTGVVLALVSFGLLVYFIHHVTRTLQIGALLESIGAELCSEFEHLFPNRLGGRSEEPRTLDETLASLPPHSGWELCEVRSSAHGYLRVIDTGYIERVAREHEIRAVVPVKIGDFIQEGEVLARVASPQKLDERSVRALSAAFSTDDTRSIEQDPLFAIQQIVDVALKALSPGINDSTTAVQCLDHLGNAMAFLLARELPGPERKIERSSVMFALPSLSDYLSTCFGPVRRAARSELRVCTHLVDVLGKLTGRVDRAGRRDVLRYQLDETTATIEWDTFTPREREELRGRIESIRARLGVRPSTRTSQAARTAPQSDARA